MTCHVRSPVNVPDLISFLQEFGGGRPYNYPHLTDEDTVVNGGTHSMNLVVLLEVKGALCPLLGRTKGKQGRDSCLKKSGWKMTTHENKAAVPRWQRTARMNLRAQEWCQIHARFQSPSSLHKVHAAPSGKNENLHTHDKDEEHFSGFNSPSSLCDTEQNAKVKNSAGKASRRRWVFSWF